MAFYISNVNQYFKFQLTYSHNGFLNVLVYVSNLSEHLNFETLQLQLCLQLSGADPGFAVRGGAYILDNLKFLGGIYLQPNTIIIVYIVSRGKMEHEGEMEHRVFGQNDVSLFSRPQISPFWWINLLVFWHELLWQSK